MSEAMAVRQGRTGHWVSLDVPAGWFWKESYTILAPDGSANVISSSEPLDQEIDLETYVQVQGDLLASEFPEYHEYRLEPATVAGVDHAVLREFAWTPPDAERVRQLQVYAVLDGRGITATATTPESAFEKNRASLTDALTSLAVRPS